MAPQCSNGGDDGALLQPPHPDFRKESRSQLHSCHQTKEGGSKEGSCVYGAIDGADSSRSILRTSLFTRTPRGRAYRVHFRDKETEPHFGEGDLPSVSGLDLPDPEIPTLYTVPVAPVMTVPIRGPLQGSINNPPSPGGCCGLLLFQSCKLNV